MRRLDDLVIIVELVITNSEGCVPQFEVVWLLDHRQELEQAEGDTREDQEKRAQHLECATVAHHYTEEDVQQSSAEEAEVEGGELVQLSRHSELEQHAQRSERDSEERLRKDIEVDQQVCQLGQGRDGGDAADGDIYSSDHALVDSCGHC